MRHISEGGYLCRTGDLIDFDGRKDRVLAVLMDFDQRDALREFVAEGRGDEDMVAFGDWLVGKKLFAAVDVWVFVAGFGRASPFPSKPTARYALEGMEMTEGGRRPMAKGHEGDPLPNGTM